MSALFLMSGSTSSLIVSSFFADLLIDTPELDFNPVLDAPVLDSELGILSFDTPLLDMGSSEMKSRSACEVRI